MKRRTRHARTRRATAAFHPRDPEHLEAMIVEDLKAAGLDPAFVYAFEKTGLLVTGQHQHLIPEADLAQWQAAIEEFEAKHRGRD